MPTRQAKYPGRARVVSRQDARDHMYRTLTGQEIAPWCEQLVELPAIGLPSMLEGGLGDTRKAPFTLRVACRKCEGCLRHRARLWTARAIDEVLMSNRTWFVTLTVRPEDRFRLGLLAEKRKLRASRETLQSVSEDDRFRLLWGELSSEVTKAFKRLRKVAGPFRYIVVAERHKDGFPHAHALIHEGAASIAKSAIQAEWRLGFSQCKLVDDGPSAAFYVAKYLAKQATARVRASVRYGQGSHGNMAKFLTERLSEVATRLNETEDKPPSKRTHTEVG